MAIIDFWSFHGIIQCTQNFGFESKWANFRQQFKVYKIRSLSKFTRHKSSQKRKREKRERNGLWEGKLWNLELLVIMIQNFIFLSFIFAETKQAKGKWKEVKWKAKHQTCLEINHINFFNSSSIWLWLLHFHAILILTSSFKLH